MYMSLRCTPAFQPRWEIILVLLLSFPGGYFSSFISIAILYTRLPEEYLAIGNLQVANGETHDGKEVFHS